MLFDLERPPHLHKGYRGHIIYLDFDGVLHPDDVWRTRGRGIHLGERALSHQLFESVDFLCSVLEPFPKVDIVLSTTWVRVLGFKKAAAYLPTSLSNRIIGATYHSAMPKEWFVRLSRGEQVRMDICRRKPEKWVVIDDASDGWTHDCLQNLVSCNSDLGLGDKKTQEILMSKLMSNFLLA